MFPPSFRELPHPSLELYDLDEAFSSEKSRLAQVCIVLMNVNGGQIQISVFHKLCYCLDCFVYNFLKV